MVEKALTQPPAAVASAPPTTVIPADGEGNLRAAAIPSSHEEVVNTRRKGRRRKFKRLRARDQTVIAAKKRKVEVIGEAGDLDPKSVETNAVLRKLLRGPRYFDPSNSSWSTCFSCGEEGHVAVFCTSQEKKKKQKPCFVCGSLVHGGKQCTKARACYICKQIGHLARVCPDKEKLGLGSSIICLKCGQSGHEMFSCKSDYSPSDLKEIQCYICRNFGHICCVDSVDIHSNKVSCYRCGQLGHTGSACSRQRGGKEGETTRSSCNNVSKAEATPIPVYNCGEGGDLSQECKSLTKMCNGKDEEAAMPNSGHKRELVEHFAQAKIHKRKSHNDEEERPKPEPQDLKANKRKKQDKKITTPQKPPKKPFKPSNKNSLRSSPPRPPYTGHMVTRVSPGDQMYNHNRLYGHDMVDSNAIPYHHHHYSHQPQSSSSPHLFHYGAESYPGLPRSPQIYSSNPHMFQHQDPSPYHDPPRIFSPNPHVFQYEASPYHDPPRIFSPNPHVFQYEASPYRSSPVSFQYGDSFAYRGSPRYPDALAYRGLPGSPGRYEFQYRDSMYRGLPRSPHVSSPGRYEFQYRDSSYRGALDAPHPSGFWNHGETGLRRNRDW